MSDSERARAADSLKRYQKGFRAAIHTNTSAYAFSVYVTTAFAILQGRLSTGAREVFLFALGHALAFVTVDALVTKGFHVRLHGEDPDVVMLGGALSALSIGAGLAATWGLALLVRGWLHWVLPPFIGSLCFLCTLALAMDWARRASERQTHDEEQEPSPQGREK